ncbi:hypothetical protein OPV22_008340 [Ensete ventricosum]|uniref:Uncharacterized protein n=1 Tax=Ensete ventricosum TaxID=4639 RepID=A0AAV8RGB0_ENSVE|nr:hypothetical protein OPV22_008340 [Ensete ventricosum]
MRHFYDSQILSRVCLLRMDSHAVSSRHFIQLGKNLVHKMCLEIMYDLLLCKDFQLASGISLELIKWPKSCDFKGGNCLERNVKFPSSLIPTWKH